MNQWYVQFPDHDGQLAARLRSESDVTHLQALDELYVYYLLRQSHADVRYEEDGRGPDFRVYAESGLRTAAVEVCSLFEPADWSLKKGVHDRLADEVNRRVPPTAGYFVRLNIRAAPREPSPRRVAGFVLQAVRRLPPHEQVAPGTPNATAVYDQDGAVIEVTFLPMREGARTKVNPEGRIVGFGAMRWGFPNGDRLRDAVAAKAGGRYDIADAPFVVAVGVHDLFYAEEQVLTGLYGRAIEQHAPVLPLRGDGLFGIDQTRPEGRHRRLSGVVVFGGYLPGLSIYANPYADRPVPADLISGARRFGPVDAGASTRLAWQ